MKHAHHCLAVPPYTLCGRDRMAPWLEAHVRANGSIHYAVRCVDTLLEIGCGRLSDWIPHDEIRQACEAVGRTVDDIAVFSVDLRPCSVVGCTSEFSEIHHWWPRHLGHEQAARFPTGRLCVEHHEAWHRATRTGSYWTS